MNSSDLNDSPTSSGFAFAQGDSSSGAGERLDPVAKRTLLPASLSVHTLCACTLRRECPCSLPTTRLPQNELPTLGCVRKVVERRSGEAKTGEEAEFTSCK